MRKINIDEEPKNANWLRKEKKPKPKATKPKNIKKDKDAK